MLALGGYGFTDRAEAEELRGSVGSTIGGKQSQLCTSPPWGAPENPSTPHESQHLSKCLC